MHVPRFDTVVAGLLLLTIFAAWWIWGLTSDRRRLGYWDVRLFFIVGSLIAFLFYWLTQTIHW